MQELNRRESEPEEDRFSDAEVEAFVSFAEAMRRGERPDVDVHLAGCPAKLADRLRPVLQTHVWVRQRFADIKARYPGLHAWHLIGLPARVR